ncbi:Abi family protein [Paenibacillus tarimensis]
MQIIAAKIRLKLVSLESGIPNETLVELSKLFKNMTKQDKKERGKYYSGVHGAYLASWLHALSNFRNVCAHYGHTYNRNFPIPPKLFARDHKVIPDNYKVYTTVFVVKYMINDKTYWNSWVERLRSL